VGRRSKGRNRSLKAKELALREKQLGVEESQVRLGHEYALKALDAQAHDRDAQRVFRRKVMLWSLWFGVFLVVLLAAFSFYAFSLGKIEMVRDLMLQVFGTGGLASAAFFAARSFYRSRKHPGDDEEG
jgi:Flp pilus assembly protein TadB